MSNYGIYIGKMQIPEYFIVLENLCVATTIWAKHSETDWIRFGKKSNKDSYSLIVYSVYKRIV